MPEIETFKTVYVTLDLSNNGIGHYDINVEFDVDEIVLKYFTMYNDAGAGGPDGPDMTMLATSLIVHYLISFPKAQVMFETLKTSFRPNNRRIQGQYEFIAYDSDGGIAVFTNLKVSFALMFIKYKV